MNKLNQLINYAEDFLNKLESKVYQKNLNHISKHRNRISKDRNRISKNPIMKCFTYKRPVRKETLQWIY